MNGCQVISRLFTKKTTMSSNWQVPEYVSFLLLFIFLNFLLFLKVLLNYSPEVIAIPISIVSLAYYVIKVFHGIDKKVQIIIVLLRISLIMSRVEGLFRFLKSYLQLPLQLLFCELVIFICLFFLIIVGLFHTAFQQFFICGLDSDGLGNWLRQSSHESALLGECNPRTARMKGEMGVRPESRESKYQVGHYQPAHSFTKKQTITRLCEYQGPGLMRMGRMGYPLSVTSHLPSLRGNVYPTGCPAAWCFLSPEEGRGISPRSGH